MKIRIIADSSANLKVLEHVDFVSVPLKIVTSEKEYEDNEDLDIDGMMDELSAYKGRSTTSCPNSGDWLNAFGDADVIFGVALTSAISGCYNAAMAAREEYLTLHPNAKVYIMDTLTTGPELVLLVEKMKELIMQKNPFEMIVEKMEEYRKHTHLMFSLESLENFAKNGRVKPAVAKMASILGIRVVGQASESGELQPVHKCRGRKKAIEALWEDMKKADFRGGKVRIAHCFNTEAAEELRDMIMKQFKNCDITISQCMGLCCYYAERGGLLVGFEG